MTEVKNYVIALGFFDGVHIGHRALLAAASKKAKELSVNSAAMTFLTHPESVIAGCDTSLLVTNEEKERLIKELSGIDEVIFLPFDQTIQKLLWQDFVKLLVEKYRACHVVCGYNYHFGYRGQGDARHLRQQCLKLSVGCDIIKRVCIGNVSVSSTYIRDAVTRGDVELASEFLGYSYFMTGEIEKACGQKISGSYSFIPAPGILQPKSGLYEGRILFLDSNEAYSAAIQIKEDVKGRYFSISAPDASQKEYRGRVRAEFLRMIKKGDICDSL